MKKILPFLVAGALLLPVMTVAGGAALAQRGGGECGQHEGHGGGGHGRGHHGNPADHVAGRTRMLTAMLDLDARQQADVTRILTAAATEMQTLFAQPRSEAQHTAMQALHQRTSASIAAALNPTQRATFQRVEAARTAERESHRAEREARRAQRGGPGGHGHGPGAAPTAPSTPAQPSR